MQGFVIVAVEEHEVALAQQGIGDDLVGGARAIEDEIGLVGAEHPGRMTLRLHRRAFVNEKVAEVDIGIAEIVAEDALTEMLEEELAGRRLAIKLTTLVARTIKGDVGLAIIGHEAAEEGRQQRLAIFHQACDHLLGIEGGRLMPEVDIAIDLAGLAQTAMSEMRCESARAQSGVSKADGTNRRAPGCAPARDCRRRPWRYRRRRQRPRTRRGRNCC